MRIILLELWPAFIPLILYGIWLWHKKQQQKKSDDPLPNLTKGAWFWAITSSTLIAVICLLWMGLQAESNQGEGYEPAHLVNGTLVKPRHFHD